MKKVYFLLLSVLLFARFDAISQCTNTSAFGTGTISPTGSVVTLTTCAFAGEYSTINGAVAGQTLVVASSVTTDFITIRSGTPGGPVVASGNTPLSFTNTFTGTLFAHWNTNAACGTASACRTGTVQCTNCTVAGPANDNCSGAITINCGQTITGTTVGANPDAVPTCGTTLNTAAGVWYTFVGDGSLQTLSLCGSGYDTKIGVFTGTCAGLTCVTGNDDFCGLQSQVNFPTVNGTTYYVLVTGFSTASGNFTLTRTCTSPIPNDACAGALPLGCGQTVTGTTTGATVDVVPTCVTTLNTAPGVWYQFTGDGSQVTLSLCGSAYDTKIGVFSGTCGALTCVTGNDDFCGLQSQVTFNSVNATNYFVLVTGFGTANGSFTLTRTCIPQCTGVPSPGVITGPAAPVCSGTSVTLNLSGATSAAGLTYQWRSSATPGGPYTAIPGATGASYTFPTVNTAYYICTVTCSNSGLSANTTEFTVTVSRPVHANVTATATTACTPGVVTVSGSVSGGIGNYTHQLTGPGTIGAPVVSGPNNSNVTFTVTNLPAGNHTFTLRSTDAISCFVQSTASATINATPVVTINPTAATICNGAIQTITASAGTGGSATQSFTSTAAITIPSSGNASPYPSAISVTGLPATGVTVRSVTISGINHTWPDDLDIVLVSPTGVPVVLMSDCGGSVDLTGQTYTFDDAAANLLADGALSPTGTYRPTNFVTPDNWPAPGPGSLTQATPALSSFTGNANGTWSLYVVDDLAGDQGSINGGWSITFNVPVPPIPVTFSPLTGLFTDAAATVPYTGTAVTTVYARPATTTTYTASATANGCTGTATSVITVNQLPAITTQPTALAAPVCPGFNVTYTVGATGTGISIQWQVSTDNGATWTNLANSAQYSGVTTNTLTIINVATTLNNYRYRAVVTGTCPPAATSNSVTLVVSTPPTITTQPTSRAICAGQNTTFSVVAAGTPAPTIYQWQVSTNGGTTWTNLTTGGSFTPNFTITGATTALNNNQYRVIVTNSCGQSVTSAAAVLTVNALSTVSIAALPARICISDTLVPLSATPVGGSWSGVGISGFNFVPPATAIGSYPLTYSFTNAAGCTSTASVTATVVDCPERVRLLRNNAVILFPNPNNGRFNVRINSVLYNYLGMNVYNTAGQLITQKTYSGLVFGRVIPIDLSYLPGGNYMVKFFYDDGVRTSEKTIQVMIGRN